MSAYRVRVSLDYYITIEAATAVDAVLGSAQITAGFKLMHEASHPVVFEGISRLELAAEQAGKVKL